MKLFAFTLAVLVAAVTAQEKYESRWNSEEVDNLLSNGRLLRNYVNCLLDKGPCTPEAKSLKDKLPEALASKCSKCTADQKVLAKKVAVALMEKHPDYWRELGAKYDPEQKYLESFQSFLKS